MIAAIYARKSTDQNLPDAEKSVTRHRWSTRRPMRQGKAGPSAPRTSTSCCGNAWANASDVGVAGRVVDSW